MTEQRIRDLLDEVARPVPAPDLAEQAWRRAGRVRQRRLAAVSAATAVAAVVGGVALFVPPPGDDDSPVVQALEGRTFVSAETATEADGPQGESAAEPTVRLEFTDDDRFEARAGCGAMTGEVWPEVGRLALVHWARSTAATAYCTEEQVAQDRWLADLLAAEPAYRLAGDTLTVTSGTTRLVLRDYGDSLLGRTFVSTVLTENGKASDIRDKVRLRFTRNGLLRADVCNSWGSAVDLRGGRIRASGGSTTDMGCPGLLELEGRIHRLLGAEPAWRVDGPALVLTAGKARLELLDLEVAKPDVALEGRTWTAYTTDPDGEGYDSSLLETQLRFADGKVTGTTGCRPFTGNATVSGDRITFSGLAFESGGPPCPKAQVEPDRHVRALLDGTLTFDIESAVLHLRSANGEGLSLSGCQRPRTGRQEWCS